MKNSHDAQLVLLDAARRSAATEWFVETNRGNSLQVSALKLVERATAEELATVLARVVSANCVISTERATHDRLDRAHAKQILATVLHYFSENTRARENLVAKFNEPPGDTR